VTYHNNIFVESQVLPKGGLAGKKTGGGRGGKGGAGMGE